MPLTQVELGREVTIDACGMQGNIKHHLDNLGILPGQRITPLLRSAGNIIIKVGDGRLAIDKSIAETITVH